MTTIFLDNATAIVNETISSRLEISSQKINAIVFANTGGRFCSISLAFWLDGNKLKSDYPCQKTRYPDGNYHVVFDFEPCITTYPTVEKQYFFPLLTVTVFSVGDMGCLLLETEENSKIIKTGLRLLAHSLEVLAETPFVIKIGNVNGDGYFVIADKDLNILKEGKGSSCFEGNVLQLTTRKCDMKRHRITKSYELSDTRLTLLRTDYVCENEHIYIREMVPWLFLEAILAGDYDEAVGYLSGELAEKREYLPEFFEGICDIVSLDKDCLTVGVVRECGDERICSIVRFVLNGREIEDITEY